MGTDATTSLGSSLIQGGISTTADKGTGWLRLKWLLPVLLTLVAVVVLMIKYWHHFTSDNVLLFSTGFAIVLSAFLSALPAVLCVVQNVSRRRQLSKLESLKGLPVSQTISYRTATNSIESVRLVVDADYVLPIFLLFFITLFGFITIFIGYSRSEYFAIPTVLLGGLNPPSDKAQLIIYQSQTFCVMAMAFVGSYVYSLGRTLDRINNNDLYPISLHYYTARVIIACAAAAVVRHSFLAVGEGVGTILPPSVKADAAQILLLVGFAIGFAPDLFILAISRRAFQVIKVWGTRSEPGDETRPRSMPLLMIDDLTRDKIDRLNELGIDSAQILARQNPFLLLPRLPFDLSLLVDWIAQAQLYVLVKDKGLQDLRAILVRNLFDLHIRLQTDGARQEVCGKLGLTAEAGEALRRQLDEDPSFLRLRELQAALKPPSA